MLFSRIKKATRATFVTGEKFAKIEFSTLGWGGGGRGSVVHQRHRFGQCLEELQGPLFAASDSAHGSCRADGWRTRCRGRCPTTQREARQRAPRGTSCTSLRRRGWRHPKLACHTHSWPGRPGLHAAKHAAQQQRARRLAAQRLAHGLHTRRQQRPQHATRAATRVRGRGVATRVAARIAARLPARNYEWEPPLVY
jgi:hypothetical protein